MNKVLLIGIDGASFDFLLPWIERGVLPVFKDIIEHGSYGVLNSTVPCMTCPALPTIYTGMNPGNLGIFSFLTADGSVVSTSKIPYKALWTYLNEAEIRTFISNLRTTFPPENINGIMICSLHGIEKRLGLSSWANTQSSWVSPDRYQKELQGWAIDYRTFNREIRRRLLTGDMVGFNNLKKLVDFRARKFKELLIKTNCDFAFHWIEHSDTISHLCCEETDLILKFYQECIEPLVAELIEAFNGWNIIFISDHGSAYKSSAKFHINSWLMEKGYLKISDSYRHNVIRNFLKYKYKLQRSIKRSFGSRTDNKDTSGANEVVIPDRRDMLIGVDWHKTIAYSDISWGIKINTEVVSNNKDRLIGKIIDDLKSVKTSKGENIIVDAWKREDIYKGRYIDQIPDIIFVLNKEFLTDIDISQNIVVHTKKQVIGNHFFSRNAMILAHGPDIAKSNKIGHAELYDILPTILFMYGLKIPNGLDGKVIKGLFRDEVLSCHVAKKDLSGDISKTSNVRDLTLDEEKKIKNMLKSLGYLD